MLDTLTLVETPEGISLHLRSAGLMPRAAAWAIDFAIRLGIVWATGVAIALLGKTGMAIYLLVLFVVFWSYPVLFEVLRDGQTLGKRALNLRVVADSGAPVGWVASITRNLMRTVDMLPFCYGFGAVASLVDPRSRRLGDMVAGTLVVHAEPRRAKGPPALPAAPVQPPVVLAPAERAAIVAFAERAPLLTNERQQELAALLQPLTGTYGNDAVQRLLGMASAILGRRS